MVQKHFSQKQKLSILRSAKQTTVKDAANIAEVHFTTVYDWKKQFEVMGEQSFLEYQVPRPGRGIKKISPQKEQAVIGTWEANPEYGPGQVRNQLSRYVLSPPKRAAMAMVSTLKYGCRIPRDFLTSGNRRNRRRRSSICLLLSVQDCNRSVPTE